MKKYKYFKRLFSLLLTMPIICSSFPISQVSAAETSRVKVNQAPLQAVYDSPATDWQTQTLPLGNGFIGASVYGGIESEEILINEHTLWSGGPGANDKYDGGHTDTLPETNHATLKSAREQLAQITQDFTNNYTPGVGVENTKDYPNLSDELKNSIFSLLGEKTNFGTYQELGSIRIDGLDGSNPLIEYYAEGCANKNISGLFDGVKSGTSNTNKWYSAKDGEGETNDSDPINVVIRYFQPKTISSYALTAGNHTVQYHRCPTAWKLYGSNDGEAWTELDAVTGASFESAWQTKTFTLDEEVSYSWYKWSFSANEDGGTGIELGELEVTRMPVLVAVSEADCGECQQQNIDKRNPMKQLFDNNQTTKWYSGDWLVTNKLDLPDSLVFEYADVVKLTGYQLKLADDSVKYGRYPTAWNVYGSNDGNSWTKIASESDVSFTKEYEQKAFMVDAAADYKWYKIEFTAAKGGNNCYGIQLSELKMDTALVEEKEYTYITSENDNCKKTDETVDKIFDGNNNTKWYSKANNNAVSQTYPLSAQIELKKSVTISKYGIVTGNDSTKRDPKSWVLSGSNDGSTWVSIDEQKDGALPDARNTEKIFTLTNNQTYRYLKFTVNAVKVTDGSNGMQMSELNFYDANGNKIDFYAEEEGVTNYRRVLDLDNATVTVSYDKDNVKYNREYFVSNPGNFMAARLTAEKSKALTKMIRFSTLQINSVITAENNTITITGAPADQKEEEHLKFAAQIKVKTDGTTEIAGGVILIKEASYIELYMTAGTNYQQCMDDSFDYFKEGDPLNDVKARLEALEGKTYDQLKADHVADHKELFGKVKLDLAGAEQPSKMTDDLLTGYKNGTNTAAENRYLEMLYYQFGRYLLIASSREGSLPANLQGIWGKGLSMPWNADYHTNINIQMNYWLAEQTNLSECHQPMIDYINSLVPRGEITAKTYHYNVNDESKEIRGWTTYHENNIWGNTAPSNYRGSTCSYFPAAAAWLCQHIWEQYAFTLDEVKLASNYDTLKSAALFWVDNLVVDPRDNTLVASPSSSPEHGPFTLGTSSDQTMIWELFNNTLQAAEILGDNSSEIQEIETAMGRLSLPKIGVNGQYMEWKDEVKMDVTGDNGHRHVNHLFAVHPGTLVVANRSEEDNAFVEAMKVTLNTRGDGGTGWSKAWKINFWARLRDGEHAGTMVRQILKQSTYANLYNSHPKFQIDGNFGATAGMTEMFLQSQGDAIELLPALPSMWNGSSVSGLRARGNVEVDIKADANGKVATAVLKPESSHDELKVRAEGLGSYSVEDSSGNAVNLVRVDEDTLTFAVTAGETYTLIPGNGVAVTGVSLDETEINMQTGGTKTLVATVTPEDASNKTIIWTTSDETIATVADGTVNALAEGEVTITATTDNGKTAECKVIVTDVTAIENAIEAAKAVKDGVRIIDEKKVDEVSEGIRFVTTEEMEALDTAISIAKTAKEAAKTKEDVAKVVAELNTAVEKFNQAIKVGTNAEIIDVAALEEAIAAAEEAKEAVKVIDDKAADVVDEGTKFVTTEEMTSLITAIVKAKDVKESAKTDEEVTNAVTALNEAVTTFNGIVKTGTYVDSYVAATGVTLSANNLTMNASDTAQLTATVIPENATNKNITWKSSDENVVTVDGNGNVNAVAEGTANITVTLEDGGKTFSILCVVGGKTLDKSALEAAITKAKAVIDTVSVIDDKTVGEVDKGTSFVTTAEKQTLTDAITTAENVLDTAADGADLTEAVQTLNTAVNAFKNAVKEGTYVAPAESVDVTALVEAIKAAEAAKVGLEVIDKEAAEVEGGTKFVTTAEKQALMDAIITAEVAAETSKNANDVTNAVNALNAAVTTFNDAIKTGAYIDPEVVATLDKAIEDAKTAADSVSVIDDKTAGQVTKGEKYVTSAEKKALTDAIAAAEALKATAKTAAEVADAVEALNEAVATFNNSVKVGTYVAPTPSSKPDGNNKDSDNKKEESDDSKETNNIAGSTVLVETQKVPAVVDNTQDAGSEKNTSTATVTEETAIEEAAAEQEETVEADIPEEVEDTEVKEEESEAVIVDDVIEEEKAGIPIIPIIIAIIVMAAIIFLAIRKKEDEEE